MSRQMIRKLPLPLNSYPRSPEYDVGKEYLRFPIFFEGPTSITDYDNANQVYFRYKCSVLENLSINITFDIILETCLH